MPHFTGLQHLPCAGYELGRINRYYLEIVVWDHIVPISDVYVKGRDTSWPDSSYDDGWFKLQRSEWNEFESSNLPELQAPFDLATHEPGQR